MADEKMSLTEAASILRQTARQQRGFARLEEVAQTVLEHESQLSVLARKLVDAREALIELDTEVEQRKALREKAEEEQKERVQRATQEADDKVHEAQRQAEDKVRKTRLDAEQEIAAILRTLDERRTQQAAWNDKIARVKDEHTALMAQYEGQRAELQAKVDALKAELATTLAKYQG